MIIKAKSSKLVDVITLFYSNSLWKSIYLNTYFFNLKFLSLFNINMNVFYYLSINMHFAIQNYWDSHYSAVMYFRYKKIVNTHFFNINFFCILFTRVVSKKYLESKLI